MAPEFGKPIHHLPLIPANVLKKHCVHEPLDTRFRSAARLLQALWREDRACRSAPMSTRMASAANSGNFLTPEIADTARREAALSRGRRARRRGAAGDKPLVEHAAHLQFARALGAHSRT